MDRDQSSPCRSCEGRGWKVTSRRERLSAGEIDAVLAVRACTDCGGTAIESGEPLTIADES
ncbi:hypothetical protein ABZS66_35780 [Dactylosporangium sp. NPDC005572]|uniref:hypothetical protein n=1 Tax=Dactylosporangium sp. NPDC005572 TaxID=3156889 RepID=UPI0033A93E77